MNGILPTVLRRQSQVLLENTRETLEGCADASFVEDVSAWPVWKQFCHLLHSLDEWFIDPTSFREPDFHRPHCQTSDLGPGSLSKQQLLQYFRQIRLRVEQCLDAIDTELLETPIGKGPLTRFDVILVQFRHVMHHVGYLHCYIKTRTGASPRYIGTNREW